jgi:RNA polymerase sigma-70 factor (sigma-E family)
MATMADRPPGPEGGGEAFAALYASHRAPMVRLAFLLTAGDGTAEELVHDAFLRVAPRIGALDQPAAYLRRAVVNACLSQGRRRSRERVLLLRRVPTPESVEDHPNELRDAIRALPPRQRAAVVLRYYEDLPEAAIAEALGTTVPGVKSLLHRALGALREAIEP